MKKSLGFLGFCPTLNEDIVIDVIYELTPNGTYTQIGADCEYASYHPCIHRLNCPIRTIAPKETSI